ncbi:hypothetical protein SteCoe_31076 [Stentor coeruleus]|uniref:Uncharacterized protein n=1 Tax=Stentor coeruleus TaxID=5963 RepID=A0A1R2B249_9CILI|nr:hypothetical protein SteCoe_31076 [Stentor coeruleus]
MESLKGSSKISTISSARKTLSTHSSQKIFTKNLKISNLKESFIGQSNEKNLCSLRQKAKSKLSLNPHNINIDHEDHESKSPKLQSTDMRKCIDFLKNEAEIYVNSSQKNHKNSYHQQKKSSDTVDGHETRESEFKDSFNNKLLGYSGNYEEFKAGMPKLSKDDMSELKGKIEFLMTRMQKSEDEAKIHELENVKLIEIIKNLEDKLENIKLFHEPVNVSCSSKCEVF